MNEIFCFGDGFAANHIWPEWPAIIEVLYPLVKNFGAIGAGNEFITTEIIEAHKKTPDAFYLVQWAAHNRFDKLVEDKSWNEVIQNDAAYHFNVVNSNNKTWWLSSASTNADIKQYHRYYIQTDQSKLRTENYKYLVNRLLKNQSIFFSTIELDQFSKQDRFRHVRQNTVQPSPIVHMAYVEEVILPKMPIKPDTKRIISLRDRINDQEWIPFHWDRTKIWHDITKDI
jgi:hypothetical protein